MQIISWNVNGINSTIKNGLLDFISAQKADVYCFQETKVSEKTVDQSLLGVTGYHRYWNLAEKNGYSGVMVFSKMKPLSVQEGLGIPEFDTEGRLQILEYADFFLFNCYFPNAQRGLTRLDFKLGYNAALYKVMEKYRKKKPIVICGDFNVAHEEIDLKNPKSNRKNAGFTDQERKSFTALLDLGYIDTFRMFNSQPEQYSWWSYRNNARERNIGWRIDYFVVSKEFKSKVLKSEILQAIQGSDHAPIQLEIA